MPLGGPLNYRRRVGRVVRLTVMPKRIRNVVRVEAAFGLGQLRANLKTGHSRFTSPNRAERVPQPL